VTGEPEKWAVISVDQLQQLYPAPINLLTAAGAAAVFGFVAGENTCDIETLGVCQLFRCDSDAEPEPQPSLGLNAGEVTITGLASELPLNWAPMQRSYMSEALTDWLWTESQEATVEVTGSDDVPSFSLSLVVPNPIAITSPPATGDSTYVISKASDLDVAWTGGADGFVTVSLQDLDGGPGISCIVDAVEGELSVPASFLAELGDAGYFSAGVTNVVRQDVDDWLMQFQASSLQDQGNVTFSD
jgi:hypothetical protein